MTGEGEVMVRVAVDQELCIGGGVCELLEPEVFKLADDIVISSVIGDGLLPRERAIVVVDRCPSRAIAIVEEEL
jgi:ferredoxin